VLGLCLFGWFVHQAGPAEILANIRQLGWLAPLAMAPYFLVYVFDTLGWYLTFGAYAAARPSYLTLFRLRWAGESVNNVIPSGNVGGEAVKVYLLHKRGVPGLTAGTSVVTSKTCQVLAQVVFIGLGSLAALPHLPANSGARGGMGIITAGAFGVACLLFLLQRQGMFSTLHRILNRLSIRIKKFEEHQAHFRQLDDQIYGFYHQDRRRFFVTTAAYLLGWLSDAIEILLICHLLGLPISWTGAIAIESFISVAKVMGVLVPGALGVQESGVVLLFHLFGLPAPVAAAYAIIRRGRELLYVLVGGALLYAEETSFKSVLEHAADEPVKSALTKS